MAESELLLDCFDDSDDDDVAVAAAAACMVIFHKKKRPWVTEWILNRDKSGAYHHLLHELRHEDSSAVKNFLRMSYDTFLQLLELVEPAIKRSDTNMRQAITAGERLAITLRFLASGNSFTDLMYLFRVPDNTIHGIVMDTCTAIYAILEKQYLKMPSSPIEWQEISKRFEHRWNLPNCIGAMDGKHIRIAAPGGSMYFNYHGYSSIILLALVDADYKIIYCDVGSNGKAGDAAVFRDSPLSRGLEENRFGIPGPRPLPNRQKPIPHYVVADDAFPLKPYLMKPYPFRTVKAAGQTANEEDLERKRKRIYDYRHSRARRLSENVFGILANRFGVFQKAMKLSPEKATTVTLACIALHNFLLTKQDKLFVPHSLSDSEDPLTHEVIPGDWRSNTNSCFLDLDQMPGNNTQLCAREIREEIKEYVNNEGAVEWQERIVFGN